MGFRAGSIGRFAAMVLLAGQCALAPCALAEEVYKTVDPQGHVAYSDHPISATSQPFELQFATANAQEADRLAKEQASQSAVAAEEAQQAQKDAAEQEKKRAEDAARKQRCDTARNRYAMFANGGRLTKTDEQGNRVFYSDEEIAAEAVASKAAMESACSP